MKAATYLLAVLSIVCAITTIQVFCRNVPANSGPPEVARDSVPTSKPTSQPAASVRIDNFSFQPKQLTVNVGTIVTWMNADDVPHTATSKDDPQVFDSGPLDTDDKFSFTFRKPGKYTYFCKVHPHMTGVVTVK